MIENTFDLILVSEYFDESMILLKNALCWELDDVVSFKLNSRSNKTRQDLSPRTMEKIKQWNSLDWKLYLHFNATFWRKIDEMVGREEMQREVERLRERRAQLMKTCLQDEGAVDPSQIKDTSLKPFQYGAAVIQGYNLNPELDKITKSKCQSLIMPELQYTALLYTKQFPDIAAKLSASSHQLSPGKSRTHHSRNWEARKAIAQMRNVKNQVYKGHRSFSNWTTASSLQNVP
ncbi:G3ST2 sulfotransferase, partial [Atractosteus spatula]|nr:G3ST2 sulfotransferase [Atractosteus spatula]